MAAHSGATLASVVALPAHGFARRRLERTFGLWTNIFLIVAFGTGFVGLDAVGHKVGWICGVYDGFAARVAATLAKLATGTSTTIHTTLVALLTNAVVVVLVARTFGNTIGSIFDIKTLCTIARLNSIAAQLAFGMASFTGVGASIIR